MVSQMSRKLAAVTGVAVSVAKLTIARTLATVSLAFVLLVYTAAVIGHMKTKLSLIVTAGVMTEGIGESPVIIYSHPEGAFVKV